MDLEFPKVNMVWGVLGCLAIIFTIFQMFKKYSKRQRRREQTNVDPNLNLKLLLENKAQEALRAIGCNRNPVAFQHSSDNQVKRGHHVYNNGLLGFHRSVLKHQLISLGVCDEILLGRLVVDLIPLSLNTKDDISKMVVHFSSEEFYVDYNADVFGEYVKQLREALVAYLKAETSVDVNGRYGIQETCKRVQFIAVQMVNHEVYVDPMARDRWLKRSKKHSQKEKDLKRYNLVRDELNIVFQNPTRAFENVLDNIHLFRQTGKWSWEG